MTQLVGWPADESRRPTHANISREFESLIARAGAETRGGGDVERSRAVDPALLGVTSDDRERAAKLARRAGGGSNPVTEPHSLQLRLQLRLGPSAGGSVVAFYAAQPFQTTPELPRPGDAPRRPENSFGLLTYTLTVVLKQAQAKLTYRELANLLVARYDAERGAAPPTPERSPTRPLLPRVPRVWFTR